MRNWLEGRGVVVETGDGTSIKRHIKYEACSERMYLYIVLFPRESKNKNLEIKNYIWNENKQTGNVIHIHVVY